MPDNIELNPGTLGSVVKTDEIGGLHYQQVKISFGVEGVAIPVSSADPMPVSVLGTPTLAADASTETTLAAILAKLSADPATQTTLAAVLAKLIAGLNVNNFPATQDVTGTFFQTTQPVSASALPLPSGAATSAKQDLLLTELQLKADLTETQPVSLSTIPPLVSGAAIIGALVANQSVNNSQIVGNPVATGNGVSGTGVQRVSIASDNSPIPTLESVASTVLNGKTTVNTAATRVVLAASIPIKSVTIKSISANTGIVYVGSSTVTAANGFELYPGDTVTLDIANLNTVNIDASVNGQIVSYIAIN